MPEQVSIRIAGKAYAGWKQVALMRSLEALCGTFRFEVGPGRRRGFPIAQGDACEVYAGKDRYLTGYVDALDVRYSKRDHAIALEGRDRAADLVDSGVPDLASEYYQVGLLELGQLLAEPFGVKV